MEEFTILASGNGYRQKLVKAIQSELRIKEKKEKPSYTQYTHLIAQYKQAMVLAPSGDQSRFVKKHIDKLRSDFAVSC
ncbi:MAG: hypothetical protein E3J72_19505 [Planctomycetota bacterium]|nr:MAG: hypothetical protein E3J72_19505 [Planctomycetota bacterium]